MIRCGECGFAVTAEVKTNRFGSRYTYYHCSKRRLDMRCGQKYVPLDELEHQIVDFLASVSLPEKFQTWVIARLERTFKAKKNEIEAQRSSLSRAQLMTERELENLTKPRIRDLLTDEEYTKQREELSRRQVGNAQTLKMLQDRAFRFEPARLLISFNKNLVSRFLSGDLAKRRLILNIVGYRNPRQSLEASLSFHKRGRF
jgi:site-specific DNA recombinase